MMLSVIAHASNDNDDDKYPKDHIKVKIAATSAAVIATFSHFFAPPFLEVSIYYENLKKL